MELKIITIEDDVDSVSSVLKNKARQVNFPLSAEDKQIIACMQAILFKADGVGLAAPQVGIGYSIAVVYIPESASLLRENAAIYSMHTLINPEYTPVDEHDIVSDFEGCYSVKRVYGKVLLCARYFSPPLRQMRSPLHTNFFAAFCHPPC